MREVLSSAAEAELDALFHNGKEACPLRIALEEMGHPQPATPMATDNSTASGIATDTVKQKRSKAIDMRFYWIRDRVRQGQFRIYWSKGQTNWRLTPNATRVITPLVFVTNITKDHITVRKNSRPNVYVFEQYK